MVYNLRRTDGLLPNKDRRREPRPDLFYDAMGALQVHTCRHGACFVRRGDKALGDIPQTIKIVDEILAYDSNYKDHLAHVIRILQRCDQHGITLNKEKFRFGEKRVNYCGYSISSSGYTSDTWKTKAIADFPRP